MLSIISPFVISQVVSEKDLHGCWQIVEMKSEDGKEISINDLNGPGIFIICFLNENRFVSKVENDGVSTELGSGNYSILKDGKTIRQKQDGIELDSEDDMDMEVLIIDANNIQMKGSGVKMNLRKKI